MRTRLLPLFLLLPLQSPLAEQDFLPGWHLSGSNTARASWYDATGLGSAGPYPFEGVMGFEEFNLYFDRRNSPYDLMRGEFSGVWNLDDEYRSTHNGLTPERVNFTREKGDSLIPWRLELGDYFAYYSYLTLQRSLKGVQIELQPVTDAGGRRHSIVLTSGADEADWRSLTLEEDYSNGISWLVADPNLGSYSLNFVHNFRDGSPGAGTLDRSQAVFSLAGEKSATLARQRLTLEAEIAHFAGDHNGVSGAASGQDRSENGYFAELRGFDTVLPLDYRLRYERYGQDFRPRGAIVTPDRKSYELHGGWRFATGLRLRGRVQVFDDNYETANKLRTRTYGVNLTGPLLASRFPGLTGTLDAYLQNRNDETGATNDLTRTVNLGLNSPLPHGWTGRAGFFYQDFEDQSAANANVLTHQLSLNADHAISLFGFSGLITPGILLRTLREGTSYSTDINPTLALALNRGPHSLRLDYGSLVQHRLLAVSGPDIDTHTLNLDYRYRLRQHELGLEASLFGRDPDPGEHTGAYRVSVFWRYSFDRPAQVLARAPSTIPSPGAAAPVPTTLDPFGLPPGADPRAIRQLLEGAGLGEGTPQAGYLVYEYPVFRELAQRQRLVLRYQAGELERSAVIIDFDDVGNRDSVEQTFERVRQELIRRHGNPTRNYHQGGFGATFVADVNAGRLVRILEWDTPQGVVRFGIPRRLDGQVRMEIVHARHFPPPGESLWSIEAVR
ncbi:MAG: hypothetical protein D6786_09250 [Gammaproteobacteria bacterium]|nr:MAG: hypothetical protein D6786_09250 [Gammaproteobacteria bacterium]